MLNTGVAARYGGDEFAVILPNTSLADAAVVAERIVNAVAGAPISWEKGKGLWGKTLEDCLLTAEQFSERFAGGAKPIWLLGEGLVYYSANLAGKGVYVLGREYWNPRAQRVHLLGWAKAVRGEFAEPISLTPKYLRRLDVKVKKR